MINYYYNMTTLIPDIEQNNNLQEIQLVENTQHINITNVENPTLVILI